jgi:hypothetical protein
VTEECTDDRSTAAAEPLRVNGDPLPWSSAAARLEADATYWLVTVRDGAFHANGAPTAGPPPYDVYRVQSVTAFGFGTDDTVSPTRWRF